MASIPRMIPNPVWTASEEARIEREMTIDDCIQMGTCPEDAFPSEYDKDIPETGCWILILTEVRVGRQIDKDQIKVVTVPHLSMWYAMPHVSNSRVPLHNMGAPRKRGAKQQEWAYLHQAIINTPDGAVHVWPHEYNKIDINKYLELCDDDGLFIHYLSDEARVDESALFYLRTRGIAKADAQRMLLGTLTNSNYCYFTVAPEIGEYFGDGCGMPYLTPINHQRRAEAAAARH